MSSATRQRRHRERERAGLVRLQIEAPAVELVLALEKKHLLDLTMADDKAAIERATTAALLHWIATVTRDSADF